MSKITFRADDDLVERVEALETSKSEVMRDALRSYLDRYGTEDAGAPSSRAGDGECGLDELVADRVDALVDARLDEATDQQDVNVTVRLAEDARPAGVGARSAERASDDAGSTAKPAVVAGSEDGAGRPRGSARRCAQCGERVRDDHVYCPNCGEKATRRIFCDCGDELRSDWAFCPGCGRRTPSADVLDQ